MSNIPTTALETASTDASPSTPGTVPPSAPPGTRWLNRFHALGPAFFTPQAAQGLPRPYWVATSEPCARQLGLPADWDSAPALRSLDVFSGNAVWPGMQPLASVYSGHQFGVWAGQLGDGRALLLGEMETPEGPMELQLKGAGRTPYSRGADGRAVLRSSIREYLCSEAMHGLGIPTTRALAVIGSDMPVRREQIESSAVVTRVAPSFIRFGHFEHFSYRPAAAADAPHRELRQLVDFVIDHHYPAARDEPQPVVALLDMVARRTGELMAAWQSVGFCHGVMNTDNMSILGLTIDYGPFGFLDAFDPGHICNHSDEAGRYAYSRQPNIGYWNLLALGQALLPLATDTDSVVAAVDAFKPAFAAALQRRMSAKVGLASSEAGDQDMIEQLLALMAADRVDFTIAFRRLGTFDSSAGAAASAGSADAANASAANAPIRDMFIDRTAFDAWAAGYAERLRREGSIDGERILRMNRANPTFVLRNHLAEAAIRLARQGDYSEVQKLERILQRPFDDQPEHAAYADFPPEWAQSIEVSCSS